MNVRPLITICGTTGVGKSNLAIELALHLARHFRSDDWQGARIINADSMQVYAGMDIITNKVPESQRQGIEHLLLGFKAPGEQYVVGEWVRDALKAIEETHERKEIPIVVGGTSYWIQHLIFPNRLASNANSTYPSNFEDISKPPSMSPRLINAIASLSPRLLSLFNNLPVLPPSAANDPDTAFDLHTLLSILDARIATRWHWKDTRKVLRTLCVIKESGRRMSDIIIEQSNNGLVNKPRFRTLCFWLYAEPSMLEPRLNKRVDRMIEDGLLNEIRSLHQMAKRYVQTDLSNTSSHDFSSVGPNYTSGLYQSIGYKEFHEYLASTEPSEEKFNNAVELMKLSTRQYAKRQVSWIRNKLLPAVHSANKEGIVAPMYLLDATELEGSWTTRVRDPAIHITQDFISQCDLPDPRSLSNNAQKMLAIDLKTSDPASVLDTRQKLICPICTLQPNRPFMVEEGREWEIHQKTRVHKRLATKVTKDLDQRKKQDEAPAELFVPFHKMN